MKTVFKKIIVTILTIEAWLVLRKYKPHVLAVTGTVGKTSTKEAIAAVFERYYFTRKNTKSFNSEIGVPLTILDLPNAWQSPRGWLRNIWRGLGVVLLPNHYPEWLILEVGTDRPGDVQKLSRWLKPDMVVLTRFADIPVHVEYFDSPDDVTRDEQSIAWALKKDGVLVVNNDDKHAVELRKKLDRKAVSYGITEKAGTTASHIETLYAEVGEYKKPLGIRFRVDQAEASGPVTLMGALGSQHMYPVLAALASIGVQGENTVDAVRAFDEYLTPSGRMRIIEGVKNITLLDDSYNSSPVATESALHELANLDLPGRKVAILGDMKELGTYAEKEHVRIGELAGSIAQEIVCVGQYGEWVREGAARSGSAAVTVCADAREAATYMQENAREKDVILVKGSQSIRTERILEALMAHPDKKAELLVRQEKEWKER